MKTQVRRLRKREVNEGVPHPCGATWYGKGTNFAIFSGNATRVELCLFNENGDRELERIELPEYTNQILAWLFAGDQASYCLWVSHPWSL
jgi:isoamylase